MHMAEMQVVEEQKRFSAISSSMNCLQVDINEFSCGFNRLSIVLDQGCATFSDRGGTKREYSGGEAIL